MSRHGEDARGKDDHAHCNGCGCFIELCDTEGGNRVPEAGCVVISYASDEITPVFLDLCTTCATPIMVRALAQSLGESDRGRRDTFGARRGANNPNLN